MANKKKGKVIQMLTPENYIRQKARTLPLYECLVNTGWEENGLANIVVARKHTTGNITTGMYLVDLKCLGVKDASYWFNISELQYSEILKHAQEAMEMERVSYELVHNIVYAGLDFADEYGFKPHKDFTVAQYILEEDSEDIELMEIECGMDGKPAFIRGPYDNDAKVARIISLLEKTAGPGNYIFIDEDEDWDEEEDETDNEFTPSDTTFQFKIELDGVSNPKVWRRLTMPSNATFLHFHYIIQFAFGWEDDHLFSFSEKPYESPEITDLQGFDDDNEKLDAGELMLSHIFKKENQKYTYIYDFGDSWEHKITLEKILPETALTPGCLDGEGKCPPEDCGGAGGYANLKKILADKKHPEYRDYADWLGLEKGKKWNAAEFDIEKTREALKHVI